VGKKRREGGKKKGKKVAIQLAVAVIEPTLSPSGFTNEEIECGKK